MAGALEGDIFIGPKAEVIPSPTEGLSPAEDLHYAPYRQCPGNGTYA